MLFAEPESYDSELELRIAANGANTRIKAIVTGSGGLIGSECVRLLTEEGWEVIGVDNDMRRRFFGAEGSTKATVEDLRQRYPHYQHFSIDVADRNAVRDLLREHRPHFIIHTAAQPSHDKAAEIPYLDFDVNTVGTHNLLVAARDCCPESPFVFTSTNKVYGDRPNQLPLIEKETRFDYADGLNGIDETMSIDQCLHSPFGASKAAADLLCQEFGLYFQMPTGIFRGGCLTGPQQSGVELHGYLNYIVKCAVEGRPYTIFGYKGKQVRDQIHARDVARLFLEFFKNPRRGEVYNLGGGRRNSVSVLETIEILAGLGYQLPYTISEKNRKGDHVCYISELSKIESHFPDWKIEFEVPAIVEQIVKHQRHLPTRPGNPDPTAVCHA